MGLRVWGLKGSTWAQGCGVYEGFMGLRGFRRAKRNGVWG